MRSYIFPVIPGQRVQSYQPKCNRQKMARGRKPIQRTVEEAQKARREQVRRNVQAFRQRKNALKLEQECDSHKEKHWIFVEDGLALVDRTSKLAEKSNLTPSDSSVGCTSLFLSELDLRTKGSIPRCSSRSHNTSIHPIQSHQLKNARNFESLPPEIHSATLSRQQLVSNSAEIFFPGSGMASAQFNQIGPHWVHILPIMVNNCKVMDTAVQALCLLQITSIEKQGWLYQASRSYYGQALQKLSFALSHDHRIFQKGVFATSIALSIYELFDCTTDDGNVGRMVHLRGAASYLERFSSNNDVLGYPISFYFLETVCIFDALRSRKASPYAQSQWWDRSLSTFGGGTYGPLMRLMTLLPPLLEQSDILILSPGGNESFEVCLELLERALVLEGRLNSWLDDTIRSWSDFRFDDVPTSTKSFLDSTYIQRLSFPSLFVARLYLLYWSSIIVLHGVLSSVESFIERCPKTSPIVHEQQEAHKHAVNICKAAGYCLQPCHGMIGKSALMLPLWIARLHFESCSAQEARYCSKVLNELGQNGRKGESPERFSSVE